MEVSGWPIERQPAGALFLSSSLVARYIPPDLTTPRTSTAPSLCDALRTRIDQQNHTLFPFTGHHSFWPLESQLVSVT